MHSASEETHGFPASFVGEATATETLRKKKVKKKLQWTETASVYEVESFKAQLKLQNQYYNELKNLEKDEHYRIFLPLQRHREQVKKDTDLEQKEQTLKYLDENFEILEELIALSIYGQLRSDSTTPITAVPAQNEENTSKNNKLKETTDLNQWVSPEAGITAPINEEQRTAAEGHEIDPSAIREIEEASKFIQSNKASLRKPKIKKLIKEIKKIENPAQQSVTPETATAAQNEGNEALPPATPPQNEEKTLEAEAVLLKEESKRGPTNPRTDTKETLSALLDKLKTKLNNNNSKIIQEIHKGLNDMSLRIKNIDSCLTSKNQTWKKLFPRDEGSRENQEEKSEPHEEAKLESEAADQSSSESHHISKGLAKRIKIEFYQKIGKDAKHRLDTRGFFNNLFAPTNKKIYQSLCVLSNTKSRDIEATLAIAVLPLLGSRETIDVTIKTYAEIVTKQPSLLKETALLNKIVIKTEPGPRESQQKEADFYFSRILEKAPITSYKEKQKILRYTEDKVGIKASNSVYVRMLAQELKANLSLARLRNEMSVFQGATQNTSQDASAEPSTSSSSHHTITAIRGMIEHNYQEVSSCFFNLFFFCRQKPSMPPGIQATKKVLDNNQLTDDEKITLISAIGQYKISHPCFGRRSEETIAIYKRAAAAAA